LKLQSRVKGVEGKSLEEQRAEHPLFWKSKVVVHDHASVLGLRRWLKACFETVQGHALPDMQFLKDQWPVQVV
jgi:hypothetical protein